MAFLQVRDLVVAYGAIQAVRGVSFDVEQGQIVSLIGSNGAGKTTTLRTLSGLLRPVSGTVEFDGVEIHKLPAHSILSRGVAHSPEGRRLFARMSVEENLRLGAYTRKDEAGIVKDMQRVYDLFPVLGERRQNKAGLFSGGEQQMLAIGRCLMSRPELIMLDEPSLGLAPAVVQELFRVIGALKQRGIAVLLVEQNVAASLKMSDRAYVLENGRIVANGSGSELMNDDRVRQAYLGL